MRDRAVQVVRDLPVAHRVLIAAAVVVAAVVVAVFVRWVTAPAYSLLYADLDEATLQQVIDGLEQQGVPYTIDGAGSRVLVPQGQLYATRAALASEGVRGGAVPPPGYELLDDQGVGVSDFKQRVDFQRALEGELAATLGAMDAVDTATVRLVLPDDELFADEQEPVTASVLLDTVRTVEADEIETVAFLVASSVEGLEPASVTVADTDGTVLQAPGDAGGGAVTGRLMRQTREFEQTLAADVGQLVSAAGGGAPSVVVRATLDFDETEATRETYDPDSQVALREATEEETFTGEGVLPGGAVGVDGGPLPADETTTSDYQQDSSTVEYGVDRETVVTRDSPGTVDRLSVAVVMDDGALTGLTPPPIVEVEELVTAALGLDADRGDTIAVSAVPFPAPAEDEPAEPTDMVALAGRIVAVVVLVVVAAVLLLMLRRRRAAEPGPEASQQLPAPVTPRPLPPAAQPEPEALDEPDLRTDVMELVDEQPEDIAVLLRGWLADRRS